MEAAARLIHERGVAGATLDDVKAAAGVSGYVGELSGTGLIVVVVVAAGAFTFDSRHGVATFLRSLATGLRKMGGEFDPDANGHGSEDETPPPIA